MGWLDELLERLDKYSKGINTPEKTEPVSEKREPTIVPTFSTDDVFNRAVEFVLEQEGGYVNDPNDPGGETKFGISKRAHPNLDISNITMADAKAIYYRDYWLKSGALINDVSSELAVILFDTAVNMGTGTAVRFLQRVLRVTEDGVIGSRTMEALQKSNIEDTIQWYVVNRILRYAELPTWSRYRRGWLKRTIGSLRQATKG